MNTKYTVLRAWVLLYHSIVDTNLCQSGNFQHFHNVISGYFKELSFLMASKFSYSKCSRDLEFPKYKSFRNSKIHCCFYIQYWQKWYLWSLLDSLYIWQFIPFNFLALSFLIRPFFWSWLSMDRELDNDLKDLF